MNRTSLGLALLLSSGLCFPCTAQCVGEWETAIGQPGIAGGYAAAVRAWGTGPQERIYLGGSFTSAGGALATRSLARWDPATETWSPVGTGISSGFTNAFVTSILPFDPGSGERLVVGGFYDTAGGVPETASLAMWNGSNWEAMGTGWTGTTRSSIWSMAVWNGRLFVGGGIVNQPAMIGGEVWSGVASWDGTSWTSRAQAITGFSPYVGALEVFDDGNGEALYAAGRFTSLDGVAGTGLIARWNGTSWSSVGGGLTSLSSTSGLEAMTIWNDGSEDALYVAGGAFVGPGAPACNVAKWNGTAWSSIGSQIGTGRITSLVAFDDGNGETLYIGGTAMPQINYLARWESASSQWVVVDGGITGGAISSNFPSVFGLGVVGDRLVVAGNFTQVNSIPANGLAMRTSCASVCYANCDGSTTEPILNVDDFTCFINEFAAAQALPHEQQVGHYANCDGSTTAPVLNVDDFTCFINAFAAGCP